MSQIAKRYGRALFNLAGGDLAKAKRWQSTLAVVNEMFSNPDAAKVLVSPAMPPDLKKKLLDYALDKAQADADVRHVIDAVVVAGRVALVPAVYKSFVAMIDEAQGVVHADITSAAALPKAELDEIGQALGKLLKKNVNVNAGVDPALLGGFVAKVGNYQIDMSLRTKLDGLSQSAVQDTVR